MGYVSILEVGIFECVRLLRFALNLDRTDYDGAARK